MNMSRTSFTGFRPLLLAVALAAAIAPAYAAVPKDMLVIGKAADPQTLDRERLNGRRGRPGRKLAGL